MTIPDRISKELLHEQAGLWFINDAIGSKVIVKTSSNVIKALLKECRIEFLFAKDMKQRPARFHTGLRIYDDPVNYLSITGMLRFKDEHSSLETIMNRNTTYIHFHNELNICVAVALLSFEIKDQMAVLNLLNKTDELYTGEFDSNSSLSLDSFEYSLRLHNEMANVYEIDILNIEGKLSEWEIMVNTVLGVNATNQLTESDPNEGGTLEKQAMVALDSLFGNQLYRNPKREHKDRKEELTDVLAYSEYGFFLVETKALGILNTASERTMERKVAGLKKQIKTAINQLVGASKKIKENVPIFDNTGKEIRINGVLPDSIPHCIVLVSELLAFGDWKNIEMQIMKAMVENRIYLNVIDLAEFMKYVGASRGNKDRLNLYLIERVEAFDQHKTIHLNAREVFPNS